MDKQQKLKAYAIMVMVKASNNGSVKYKPRTYKGMVIAQSSQKAKDRTTEMLLQQYKGFDGSSVTKPLITSEHIIIKKCDLYDDFLLNQHNDQ